MRACEKCSPVEPDAAWHAARELPRERTLVDDSHFIVHVLRCAACGQRYLWISTEVVDWQGGDDAQFRRVVPVTEAEVALFEGQAPDVDYTALAELGRDRRYLASDWPSDEERPRISWGQGNISFT